MQSLFYLVGLLFPGSFCAAARVYSGASGSKWAIKSSFNICFWCLGTVTTYIIQVYCKHHNRRLGSHNNLWMGIIYLIGPYWYGIWIQSAPGTSVATVLWSSLPPPPWLNSLSICTTFSLPYSFFSQYQLLYSLVHHSSISIPQNEICSLSFWGPEMFATLCQVLILSLISFDQLGCWSPCIKYVYLELLRTL